MKKHFDFLKLSRTLTPLSVILSLAALAATIILGFSYGIDFAGGNEVRIRFSQAQSSPAVLREAFSKAGLSDVRLQSISGSAVSLPNAGALRRENGGAQAAEPPAAISQEFLIRLKAAKSEEENNLKLAKLKQALKTNFPSAEILRVDSVGPQIGKELRQKGLLAVFYSLLMILVYLGVRFDLRYSAGAVFCLFHDTVLTLGLFSLLRFEVSAQTLAAILAIIGYSLNDTIVTFDRIRENRALWSEKKTLYEICNKSLQDVLSRTLITSATTLLATTSMWIFADGVIQDFAFTLTIGVAIGTYSSVFVAAPLLFIFSEASLFNKKRRFAAGFKKHKDSHKQT